MMISRTGYTQSEDITAWNRLEGKRFQSPKGVIGFFRRVAIRLCQLYQRVSCVSITLDNIMCSYSGGDKKR